MSPGKGHVVSLLPGKEGKEGGREREKEKRIYKQLYFCDAFDIILHEL